MRKRMSRRTEKDEKEEEASKCYFRNSFCSLITEEEEEEEEDEDEDEDEDGDGEKEDCGG